MRLASDTGNGNALVLVCALLCDERLFREQIQQLERQARVLVAVPDGDASLEAQALTLLDLLKARGIRRFALGGVSMGGYLAQALVGVAPDVVTALALIDTRCRADAPAARTGRLATIDALNQGRFETELDALIPRLLSEDSLARTEIRDMVRAMARTLGARVWTRQLHALLERRDTREVLKRYQGPALCLCGSRDQLTPPAEHREMASLLPQGQYRVIPGNVGHLSPLEDPIAVNRALAEFFGPVL